MLASAVRKAVNSSAFMRAAGAPFESNNVREPRGVVLLALAVEADEPSTVTLVDDFADIDDLGDCVRSDEPNDVDSGS